MSENDSQNTILLVERDERIATRIVRVLRSNGYDRVIMGDGHKAVEIVDSELVDLILMDIDPRNGGTEGEAAARQILQRHDIPVILLSNRDGSGSLSISEGIDAYGILDTSVDDSILLANIEMALRRRVAEANRVTRAIREMKTRDRILLEMSPIGIYRTDPDGNCVYANPSWLEMAGMTMDEARGRGWMKGLHPDDRETIGGNWYKSVESGGTWGYEYRFQTPAGHTTWIHGTAQAITDFDGEVTGYIGFNRDITKEKSDEEERRINIQRMESLLRLNEQMHSDRDQLAVYALEESVRLTGSQIGFINFLSQDETHVTHAVYTHRTLQQCKLPQSLEAFEISGCGLWSEAYRKRMPIIVNDYSSDHPAKNGLPENHLTLRRFVSIPIFEGSRIVAVAALGNKEKEYNETDVRQFRLFMEGLWLIIQRKRSDDRFRAIADYTYDWEDWIDVDGKVMWINPAVIRITGYTPEECYCMPDYPLELVHSDDRKISLLDIREGLDRRTSHQDREIRIIRKDGSIRWISVCWQPIYDGVGEFAGIRSSMRDITVQKQAEQERNKALREKDYLMKELNHRVKNNLAIVSSLVSMKATALGGGVDLSDIRNQIDAIRIVHEKLYASEDISHIDVGDYIGDLLKTIFSTFAAFPVTVENTVGNRLMPTKTAIPVGLIINEIATNSIKYGFGPNMEARFMIDLHEEPTTDEYVLSLGNSGEPFPEDIDFDHPNTLGLRLVSALARQLDGSVQLCRSPHPLFTVRFPRETIAEDENVHDNPSGSSSGRE